MNITKIESLVHGKNDADVNRKHFLICKSCYWCASYLTNACGYISMCPACGTNKMELLPLSDSSYRFKHEKIQGKVRDF